MYVKQYLPQGLWPNRRPKFTSTSAQIAQKWTNMMSLGLSRGKWAVLCSNYDKNFLSKSTKLADAWKGPYMMVKL